MLFNTCPVCNDPIPGKTFICNGCRDKLEETFFENYMSICPSCLQPVSPWEKQCPNCSSLNGFRIYSMADYVSADAKDIVEGLKFYNRQGFAKVMAFYFDKAIRKYFNRDVVIVPVPCSYTSKEKRGWDHMVEVGYTMEKLYGYRCVELLRNSNLIKAEQKELNLDKRLETAKVKFCIDYRNVNQLNQSSEVCLIDDIGTSFATLKGCRFILNENGFSNVGAITFLREL